MNKLQILSIGNEDEFNYLIINKNKNFFELIEKWLYKSFPGEHFSDISTYDDENDNYRCKKKNIKNYKEIHENYGKEGLRIDAFFGKNKIFVTIYTSLEKRKAMMNTLEEIADFIDAPKIRRKRKDKNNT